MIVVSFIISLLALIVASFAVAISFYDVDSNHNGGLSDKILRLSKLMKHKLRYTFSGGYRRWINSGLVNKKEAIKHS